MIWTLHFETNGIADNQIVPIKVQLKPQSLNPLETIIFFEFPYFQDHVFYGKFFFFIFFFFFLKKKKLSNIQNDWN
jgi:hypothetical protein